jgi:hypothetical protein
MGHTHITAKKIPAKNIITLMFMLTTHVPLRYHQLRSKVLPTRTVVTTVKRETLMMMMMVTLQ